MTRILFQAVENGTVRRGYSVACLRHARSVAGHDPDLMTYTQVASVLANAITAAELRRLERRTAPGP